MPINYAQIPGNLAVPGHYAEIDPSNANTGALNQRTLILGQKLATGTATAGVPVLGSSYAAARAAFGPGSMLSLMYAQARKSDNLGEIWLLPVDDAGGGTQGTSAVTVTGTATAAGTVPLYVCGVPVFFSVASGDAAAAVATKMAAAINAAIDLPATAAAATGTVTVTARHRGITSGDVDIRFAYLGPAANEAIPAGIAFGAPVVTAGTVEPTLSFANLGDVRYDYIVTPYSEVAQVGSVTTLLSDSGTGRWNYSVALYGHAFTAREVASASAAITHAANFNDQHVTLFAMADLPEPAWLVAADYGAVCSASLRADPALPLQNIVMNIKAPPRASRFLLAERNSLYQSGVSSAKVNDAGQVVLERSVTTYRLAPSGAPDTSYRDTETMATLQFLLTDLDARMETRFARKKLVSDGTPIPGGSNAVTAKTVLADVVGWYRKKVEDGLAQNPDTFAQNARAENAGNGRVNLSLPIDVANQLRVIATKVVLLKS